MKKIALATAFAVTASTAFAGGVAEPVMEPEVVAAATSSSAGGIIVPLLLLLVVDAGLATDAERLPQHENHGRDQEHGRQNRHHAALGTRDSGLSGRDGALGHEFLNATRTRC
mgnify:CR=1 FL=1